MKKAFLFSGLLASVVYVVAVIVGGWLWPEYSHQRQAISELTMATSPVLDRVSWLFMLYNILLMVFGAGFFVLYKKNSLLKVSGAMLILCSLSGLLMYFFPQDPINEPLTTSGLIHFILAGVASMGTLLAMFFAAFGFGKEGNKQLKTISLSLAIILLVFAPTPVLSMKMMPDYFGVFERIVIGSFIVWLHLISETRLKEEFENLPNSTPRGEV